MNSSMDKKNIFLGMGLLAAAFLLSFWQGKENQEAPQTTSSVITEEAPASPSTGSSRVNNETPVADSKPQGEFFTLENDKIKAKGSKWFFL